MLAFKIRGLASALMLMVVLLVGLTLIPPEPFEVPGRFGVHNVLIPTYLSISGVAPVFLTRNWRRTEERITPHSRILRLIDAGVLLAGTSFLCLITAWTEVGLAQVWCCVFFYISVSFICAHWLGSTAWIIGTTYATVLWFMGTDDASMPYRWAFLLEPTPSPIAWLTVAAVLALATVSIANEPTSFRLAGSFRSKGV